MRLTDEQIGAELRALRDAPDTTFARKLDLRVSAGFPTEQRVKVPRRFRWGRLLPAFGALAAIAFAVVVVGTNRGGSDDLLSKEPANDAAPAQTIAPAQGETQSKQAAPLIGTPPIAPVPPDGSRPRNGRAQVQELSASLGLSTDADQLQQAADGVVEVTNRYDGFVDSSDVRVGGRQSHASFSLRIPATDLRNALEDLSELGRVTLRDEASTNVTGAYVDAGKTYREAHAKVDSLLAQLRDASDPAEAAEIRQQLIPARQQLAAARAALRGIKQRVTYAPVSVQIRADGDGSWSIGDAANDAVGVLEAIAGVALIALAVLVPLAALLILGSVGAREFSRRRREATLDHH
jgi:Domain of unknown function (DUF4349)